MKYASILLVALLLGCGHNNHHKPLVEKVRVYSGDDDTWWYVVTLNNQFMYAESSVANASLATLDWKVSPTVPQQVAGRTWVNEETVLEEALGPTGEANVEASYGIPEPNSLDSMEGVPDSAPAGSGSSDSGSTGGDSGGGDSGGGE